MARFAINSSLRSLASLNKDLKKGGLIATILALEKGNCLCKSKVGVQLHYNLMAALASIPSVVATVIGLSPFSLLIMSREPN